MSTTNPRAYWGIGVVALLVVAALAFWVWRARGKPEAQTKTAEIARELEALQSRRETRAKDLKAMDVAQLARELATESDKGREPFNSSAYREMISRGERGAQALKPLLTQRDRSSLPGLLALRAMDKKQYQSLTAEFRVSVLTDALKNSKYFNTWGIPHIYWEDAAKAIIAEGRAARPSLVALLRDKREAPVFGSEGVQVQREYKYRVCDYAWALFNEIENKKVEIPTDPVERDKLIAKDL